MASERIMLLHQNMAQHDSPQAITNIIIGSKEGHNPYKDIISEESEYIQWGKLVCCHKRENFCSYSLKKLWNFRDYAGAELLEIKKEKIIRLVQATSYFLYVYLLNPRSI